MLIAYRVKVCFAFFPNGAKLTCFEFTQAPDEKTAIGNVKERYNGAFWYEIQDCKPYQS